MPTQAAPDRLVITVQTRKELDAAIERGLNHVKPAAIARRVGILVSRLAPGRYEVRLDEDLPPGTTRESWGPSLS